MLAISGVSGKSTLPKAVIIQNDNPFIYFHGRWDRSPGTWWAGSGFKLNVDNLSSLTLNLGNHTTTPLASVGMSVDYEPFVTLNVSVGANVIPLNANVGKRDSAGKSSSVVRINVEGWQNNRINLETIALNPDAQLLPYTPSKLAFQFIGDSLSAGVGSQGQYLPQGVDQAWPFLTGEFFKAEHTVNAQPGAALSDIVSYGNEHGMSFQFFKTEDTGYFYTTDHNYTTPWEFSRDIPAPTVVVIHLGANDAGQNVTADSFVETYLGFLEHLRTIYRTQPILIFTPWGWPNADGSVSYYYQGRYEQIVNTRHTLGDKNTFLVNTTGWVSWADVFPDNQHPTIAGHQKIAGLFEQWLEVWRLRPESSWATI